MGYTHFWERELEVSLSSMEGIINDFNKIIPEILKYIQLAGGNGEGEPLISTNEVRFNGVKNCGHENNFEMGIPWPSNNAGGVAGFSENVTSGTWANGLGTEIEKRSCNGSCSYETFSFPRILKPLDFEKPNEKGMYLKFCKTAFRPYDYAVISFLVVAQHHLGDKIVVSSNGTDQQWFEGKILCQAVLGYGLQYIIDEEGILIEK
jgi:hypothetical protein